MKLSTALSFGWITLPLAAFIVDGIPAALLILLALLVGFLHGATWHMEQRASGEWMEE